MSKEFEKIDADRNIVGSAIAGMVKSGKHDYLFIGCDAGTHRLGCNLSTPEHILEFMADLYAYNPAIAAAMHALTAFKNGQIAQQMFAQWGTQIEKYGECLMHMAEHDIGELHYGAEEADDDK